MPIFYCTLILNVFIGYYLKYNTHHTDSPSTESSTVISKDTSFVVISSLTGEYQLILNSAVSLKQVLLIAPWYVVLFYTGDVW